MPELRPYALSAPRHFAVALAAVTNEVTRRSPAPRDFPFFGLDHPPGAGAKLLERLSELGIFRFYERVLDLAGGLGGPARWLARRRGCHVVSVDRDHERAAASRLLVRRAHLDAAVGVAVAVLDRLPAADASFTHAWSVETLGGEIDERPIWAEVFRVVRPGGHVALQEWVRAEHATAVRAAAYPPADAYVEGLRAAGFRELRVEVVQGLRESQSALGEIVSNRVGGALGAPLADESRALDAARDRLEAHDREVEAGRLVLVQIFAQRPA